MLQQTQVATVIPYYLRFIERFPDIRALAEADLDEVLKLWEGLGYYSRARNLHAAARQLVKAGHDLPERFCELRNVRGIGDYTAAAIASIAFGEAVPVVDGNVVRVCTRLWRIADNAALPATRQKIFRRLQKAIDSAAPGDFNQALMELGARVCRPRSPACAECPLADDCRARAAGKPERYPVRASRPPAPHYDVAVGIVHCGDRILIAKRRLDQMLGGLWELPGGKLRPGETPAAAVVRELREETGIMVRARQALPTVRHAYSHFSVTLHPFECDWEGGEAVAEVAAEIRWVKPEELADLAFPAATRKVFACARAFLALRSCKHRARRYTNGRPHQSGGIGRRAAFRSQ